MEDHQGLAFGRSGPTGSAAVSTDLVDVRVAKKRRSEAATSSGPRLSSSYGFRQAIDRAVALAGLASCGCTYTSDPIGQR
jgi:hypothetical protein